VATRHVALLRGINVGRAKRVAMADLRKLVEGLGYSDVRTLLNSGNVVFTARGSARGDHAGRIEKALASRLGVSARVIVLSAADLDAVVRENPLAAIADHPSRLLVSVFADPAHRKLVAPLQKRDWSPGALGLGRRAAYLWCPGGILTSPLVEEIARALGDHTTARNWATIEKLQALAGSGTA
jgi:uncharacterized protein (DUF1697 family)